MGTRGLHAFKWRGRYYVSVSMLQVLNRTVEPASFEGYDERDYSSSFSPPCNDSWIEWTYIIDLDLERFSVNGICHFHLPQLPGKWWASKLWLRKALDFYHQGKRIRGSRCFVTDTLEPNTADHGSGVAYEQLDATIVNPRGNSPLLQKPAFVACKRIFALMSEKHEHTIRHACDTLHEADFLFREVAFLILCLASGSPNLVRQHTIQNLVTPDTSSECAAVLQDDREPEFVSKPFNGYHLKHNKSGMAPEATFYRSQGALICLHRDLAISEGFQRPIVSTVARGREEGCADFQAVILSIKYVILVRAVDAQVQHTKCLSLCNAARNVQHVCVYETVDYWLNPSDAENEEDDDEQDDEDANEECRDERDATEVAETDEHQESLSLICQENDGFTALAHFFETVQLQRLRPSSASRHGIFPNEIYEAIISHVDRETRHSCLTVSRAFREYASHVYDMDNGLKLLYRLGQSPICYHPTVGSLGPFTPTIGGVSQGGYKSFPRRPAVKDILQWVPVIGPADGSACVELDIILWYSSLPHERPVMQTNRRALDECYRGMAKSKPTDPFPYSVFEKLLPSPRMEATPQDVAGVYATVFSDAAAFSTAALSSIHHTAMSGRTPRPATRTRKKRTATCRPGLCAQNRIFFSPLDPLPTANQYVPSQMQRNFAILILIGSTFKIFNLRSPRPFIPPISSFPHIAQPPEPDTYRFETGYMERGDMALWREAGIQIDEARLWQVQDEMAARAEDEYDSDIGGGSAWMRPFNVLAEEDRPYIDRPYIDQAMEWLERLADSYGGKEQEVFDG
ncbi:hypothetical protein BDV95DRAFT_670510 [Massariosphaeria phaeospora]|uniref:F-box domain-containing protein n=1 Tax=Massariosphaeria phaeospora TaxID=100035 RepID=A0A7C8I586_9PLEO|nr:hypothetical protein BDV95DRAFT_670510 [Massariosphaeria phaeospora]